ncbi:tRNA intron endonuclease [Blakeslea trispora]|nr:tRNA intron endonuclease [Blakeslea trispora]
MNKVLPVDVYVSDTYYQQFFNYLVHVYYSITGAPKPQLKGTFMAFGQFVWVHQSTDASQLFLNGSFGKGSLSRSQPTWFKRTNEQNKKSLEEITAERRKKRRQKNAEISEDGSLSSSELLDMADHQDLEKFQLDLFEAFFLVYGLNALSIQDSLQTPLSIKACWALFCKTKPSFHYKYAVYHYYRSLGWVPRNGLKFGVDFVLYQRGPSFRHADYAIVIIPVDPDREETRLSWQWLLRLNRVCNQVKKTLLLCYVSIPDTDCHSRLKEYSIRQVAYKRWSPQRNRE